MKKRTLAIIIVILVLLASLWLARQQTPAETEADTQQTQSGLALLDDATSDTSLATEEAVATPNQESTAEPVATIAEDGAYTTKEDVSLYLYTYGHLPQNFITKSDARALGWSGGGLDDYAYGKCIGGDRFGNNEGLLPEASGRQYYECDIDTLHEDSRGAKRIVFSSDGLIYYTEDHYESFDLLYGEP